ncbi:hypothetical protein TWF102_011858 [Orbilia oligospora]|uniref:Uncharacterized protein n=1 Tax=Orbilia oligospora TaxID=2813651 RepID=A0A7C8J495_ORBOL|nr:hypothetical protein TWF102_011858 [Orbilia oligospora]
MGKAQSERTPFSLQKRDRESVFSYPGRFFGWTASWAKRLEGFSGPWPSVKRGRSLAAGCKLLGSVLIGVQVDKRLDFMNMKPWILGLSPLHGPETRLRGNQFHKLGKYHEKIKSFGKGSLGMSDEDMQHTTPSPDNSTETSPTIRDGGNTMISVGPSSRGLGYDFWVQAEEMGSRARVSRSRLVCGFDADSLDSAGLDGMAWHGIKFAKMQRANPFLLLFHSIFLESLDAHS